MTEERRTEPTREGRGDAWALAVVGVITALAQIPFLQRGISFYDEGSILAIADGLYRGSVMYRDHVTPTAPLTYELMRLLFAAFGPSLLVGRVLEGAIFVLCALLTYGILREFMRPYGAAVGALALLPLKALGFPLWTIVNYSQLALLFCLAAMWFAARYFSSQRPHWLLWAGVAVGLSFISKQNLGGLIGLSIAVPVALDALLAGERRWARLTRAAGLLLAGALPLVLAPAAFYAAQGALGAALDRSIYALTYVTKPYGLRFPVPLGSMSLGEVVFTYFPTPLAHLHWQRRLAFDQWPQLYLAIVHAVQATFVLPLLALLLGAAAIVRDFWRGRAGEIGPLVMVVLFAALSYASILYRPDWTHLMNVFPPLVIVGFVVLQRWVGSTHRWRWLPTAACVAWLALGAADALAVFAVYDMPVDTPRGRLYGPAEEATNTRQVVSYVEQLPHHTTVAFLRADPLYYFLTDRPIPTTFDLVMPGLVGPGDDERIAHDLGGIEEIIYNPKRILTVSEPITEYAPQTAHLLADGFRVKRVLNPTAVVLVRREGGTVPEETTVADLWDQFGQLEQSTLGPGGTEPGATAPYQRTSWIYYRVASTKVTQRGVAHCFQRRVSVEPDETLVTTAMLDPIAWAQVPGDPDYSPDLNGALLVISAGNDDESLAPLYAVERHIGEVGDEVRLPLDRFAGDNMELRFCVALPPSAPSDASYTLAGFVEPRVVRMKKSGR